MKSYNLLRAALRCRFQFKNTRSSRTAQKRITVTKLRRQLSFCRRTNILTCPWFGVQAASLILLSAVASKKLNWFFALLAVFNLERINLVLAPHRYYKLDYNL
jgi:hypothetical protein